MAATRTRRRLLVILVCVGLSATSGCGGDSPTAPQPSESPSGSPDPNPPGAAPTLAAVTLAVSQIESGRSTTGTATLSAFAPAGGLLVTLESSDEAIQVPESIAVAPGAVSAGFAVTSATVTRDTDVTVTGSAGGVSRTARLSLTPPPPSPIASFSSVTDDIVGGDDTSGVIRLSGPAPAGGTRFSLSTSDADVQTPSTMVIPAGAVEGSFEIRSRPVTVAKDVLITVSLSASAVASFGFRAADAVHTIVVRLLPDPAHQASPGLSSIAPATGVQGSSVAVTLTGTNFAAGASVTVSGEGVTAGDVSVESATSLTAVLTIASGASTGTREVRVTTSAGTSVGASFAVTALPPSAPTLSKLTPASGIQGTTVPVTLSGTNFQDGSTTISVSGTGITVGDVDVSSTTSISADFVIAAGAAAGVRNVTVTTPDGTSGTQSFTVPPASPTLSGLAPNSAGQGATVGVTFTGTGFDSSATISVSGSGLTVSDVSVVSTTRITANLTIEPGAAPGSRNLTVTTSAGTSSVQNFSILPSGPTLTAIHPGSIPRAMTFSVTLTGSSFLTGASVAVSGTGIDVTNVVVVSSTTITAHFAVDADATLGARSVTVTTSSGTTGSQTLTVTPPTLTSIWPSSGVPSSVVPITLTGTGFVTGATVAVSGSGVSVSDVTVVNSSQITANLTIGLGASLTSRNLTVTTSGGTSSAQTFEIAASAPNMTGISPTTGTRGTTVSVTVTGLGFIGGASLAVGGTGVTVSNVVVTGPMALTADFTIDGLAATGTRTVTVTTAAGSSTPANWFTVEAPSGSALFEYTGSQQNFVVPAGVTQVTIQAWGAQGGSGYQFGGPGGLGGMTAGTIGVTPGETIAVFVGGQGGAGSAGAGGVGGFNGGGAGGNAIRSGGGGGGASDVRQGGTSLLHRVLVAAGGGAGGGGGGAFIGAGGVGGGGTGGQGGVGDNGGSSGRGGTGGTSSAGGSGGTGHIGLDGAAGSAGNGGAGATTFDLGGGGGGGGGLFGGGGGEASNGGTGGGGGGGGGSSSGGNNSGVRSGHGRVVISWS